MIFFLVPAVAFVCGVRPQAIENHELAAFPSMADGFGFFTGLADWATDNLPLRDAGIAAEDAISNGVFAEPPAYSRQEDEGQSGPSGPVGPVSKPDDPKLNSGAAGFPKVIRGKDGWLYFGYDMKGKCHPVRSLADTLSRLHRLRTAVEDSGRRFVLVVAPDKSTEVPRHLPDNYAGKTCAAQFREKFWHRITSEAGAIDLRDNIKSAARVLHSPMYHKLDTHWTFAGALALLHEVAEDLKPGATESWRIRRTGEMTTPADLPPMLGEKGSDTWQMYSLSSDGVSQQMSDTNPPDLHEPLRVHSKPYLGMVGEPTALLGDSFLLTTLGYLPAVFSDATAYSQESAATHLGTLDRVVNRSKTVVLELVERNLSAGQVPILSDAPLRNLVDDLEAHPVR